MTYKKLFVTGMFRSGTTLLARALNTHENVSFASDVFFDFFKHIRNKYYSQTIKNFDPERPLGDKFLEDSQFYNSFLDNFLEIKLGQGDANIFIPKMAKASEPYSPKIIPFLKRIEIKKERTVKEILEDLLRLIAAAEPKQNLRLVGFKKAWLEEFIQPLLRIPNFYSLQIIRDPRAVIASNKKLVADKYPILFLIRQWRKGLAYSIINETDNRYLRIKFEDLIKNPEMSFKKISKFLKVPYSSSLVNLNQFKDGQGKQWYQNSSFRRTKKFNQEAINKWKKVLTKKEIGLIELLCGPEMKYLGYKLTNIEPDYTILFKYKENQKGLADWIKRYDYKLTEQRGEEEMARLFLLRNPAIIRSEHILDKFFVSKQVYAQLKRFC